MNPLADDARALIRDVREDRAGDLPALLALSITGTVAELAGILLLVPLLAFASGEFTLPHWAETAWLLKMSETGRLTAIALFFLMAMGLRTLLLWRRDRRQSDLVIAYASSLRRRTLAALATQGWSRTSTLGESGLQQRLIGQTGRVVFAVEQALSIIAIFTLLALQGLLAMWLSHELTFFAVAFFAGAILISAPILRQRHREGARINVSMADSSEESARLHQGLKSAIAEGETGRFLDRFGHADDQLVAHEQTLAHRQSATRAISALVVAIGAVSLVLVGRLWLDLPMAILLPLLIIFARLANPARMLFAALEQFAAFAPSFALFRDLPVDVQGLSSASAEPIDWQSLEARDVIVGNDSSFTLGPLDFAIANGEWIGIAGPTGSGKTTLVDLIAGLSAPDAGEMMLDGRPVHLGEESGWAAGLAYVGQVERLLDGSLADNLGTNRPDLSLLEISGISKLVDDIGLETPLGSRGSRLSGGEAQRVAIARALHRRPRLLILDEATAALDLASEARLLDRLSSLSPRPAIIIVAHRPQSHKAMDRVLHLDQGRILQRGD